jgi:hypothetical protein
VLLFGVRRRLLGTCPFDFTILLPP